MSFPAVRIFPICFGQAGILLLIATLCLLMASTLQKNSFVLVDILISANSLAPSNADQEKKIETREAIYEDLLTPNF